MNDCSWWCFEKLEVVILVKKIIPILPLIPSAELIVESKPTFMYLGLTLDPQMNFFEQIKAALDKAATGVSALNRV